MITSQCQDGATATLEATASDRVVAASALTEGVMPTTELPITFVVLSLNTTERSGFVRASQEVLPELELFRAVNGFSKQETTRHLATTPLKIHPYTFCNYARFATFGTLANYVSKYLALRMQVRCRLPSLKHPASSL